MTLTDDKPKMDRARYPDPRQLVVTLRPNMAFIFKPAALSADKSHICTWGDTVVVTPAVGRRLGNRPDDLAVAAGQRRGTQRCP